MQIGDRRIKRVILVGRRGQRQAVADYDGEGRIRAGTVGIHDHVGQGGGSSRVRRAGQRACAGGKVQTSRQAAWPGQSVGQWRRAAGRWRQKQIVDRCAPRVILVGRRGQRQAVAGYDREGRIRAGTVGIHDHVGQGGGISRVRCAGQRACAGGKVQTSRQAAWPCQSVRQRPRAAGRYWQLQIGDRRIKRVILVGRRGQRQVGVDRDGEGRIRAVTVGIGDRVGQGGGTSGGARRAGQRACAGGKAQTRRQGAGQSVHQRRRAAGRCWQNQIADRRAPRVILVGRRGQRQVGVDRDGEGRIRAGTVGIHDHVGQGGGISRVRCAGQRACAGVKVKTLRQGTAAWPGQSVHQRPRAAGRCRQKQIVDRCAPRVILVGRRGQRQAVADYDGEGRIRAGTVGIHDHVGQGGGISRVRCAGQRACAGVKVKTLRQGTAAWPGQSVRQRPRAAGRYWQLQIGDRRIKRVILVGRRGQRQAVADYDGEGRIRAGTVGIHDHVGQGGGISRVRCAGQRACAGGKVKTLRQGTAAWPCQSVGQWRRAAGRCWQLQIVDLRVPRVILVGRCGQRQAVADYDGEGRIRAGIVGIHDHVGQDGGTSRVWRARQRACVGVKVKTLRQGTAAWPCQSVGQWRRAAGRCWQLQIVDLRAPRVILVGRRGQRQAVVRIAGHRDIEAPPDTMHDCLIDDPVVRAGDTDLGRRAGQRACPVVKGQTRRDGPRNLRNGVVRTKQTVYQQPNAAAPCRELQIGDRPAHRVMQVGWLLERQFGVDPDRKGHIRAGTVGIHDHVGQGGGTRRVPRRACVSPVRRAGQRACVGVKVQTSRQGTAAWPCQSVHQRSRAAGRWRQLQIVDLRVPPVILIDWRGQRQALADRDREVQTPAGQRACVVGDLVGQGGGTGRARRAGQRACVGGKAQTRRHTGQSVR